MAWLILGRTREARLEVWEEAEVVCSVRMVVLWAMQALADVGRVRIGGGEDLLEQRSWWR